MQSPQIAIESLKRGLNARLYKNYGVDEGKKYNRIYGITYAGQRSAILFQDKTTGLFYDAASWQKPNKRTAFTF